MTKSARFGGEDCRLRDGEFRALPAQTAFGEMTARPCSTTAPRRLPEGDLGGLWHAT